MGKSIEELRRICQKEDVLLSNRLARKVSIYFTKLLLYTNITANQVTFLATVIAIFAGICFIMGHYWYVLAAFLVVLSGVFDCVDGEIARYRGTSSITGEYADSIRYYFQNPYYFACISFGIYNLYRDVTVFVFGFLAIISLCVISVVSGYEYDVVIKERMRSKIKINEKKLEAGIKENDRHSSFSIVDSVYRITHSRLTNIIGTDPLFAIAALIDAFAPPISVGHFTFGLLYIILILYSVCAPFHWVSSILVKIKQKSPDKLYHSIFSD